jgi:hypothetical protein
MRVIVSVVMGLLAGCATPTAPREYLDEQTAATITVVADPWIFVRDLTVSAEAQRDFLNLYAIDVNRMGDHRQYLAVLQWWPPARANAAESLPVLELQAPDGTIALQATAQDARQLGIAQPLATAHSAEAKWWYFPVDKKVLASVARSGKLSATLVANSERTAYVIWRDGSAELTELTTVLE